MSDSHETDQHISQADHQPATHSGKRGISRRQFLIGLGAAAVALVAPRGDTRASAAPPPVVDFGDVIPYDDLDIVNPFGSTELLQQETVTGFSITRVPLVGGEGTALNALTATNDGALVIKPVPTDLSLTANSDLSRLIDAATDIANVQRDRRPADQRQPVLTVDAVFRHATGQTPTEAGVMLHAPQAFRWLNADGTQGPNVEQGAMVYFAPDGIHIKNPSTTGTTLAVAELTQPWIDGTAQAYHAAGYDIQRPLIPWSAGAWAPIEVNASGKTVGFITDRTAVVFMGQRYNGTSRGSVRFRQWPSVDAPILREGQIVNNWLALPGEVNDALRINPDPTAAATPTAADIDVGYVRRDVGENHFVAVKDGVQVAWVADNVVQLPFVADAFGPTAPDVMARIAAVDVPRAGEARQETADSIIFGVEGAEGQTFPVTIVNTMGGDIGNADIPVKLQADLNDALGPGYMDMRSRITGPLRFQLRPDSQRAADFAANPSWESLMVRDAGGVIPLFRPVDVDGVQTNIIYVTREVFTRTNGTGFWLDPQDPGVATGLSIESGIFYQLGWLKVSAQRASEFSLEDLNRAIASGDRRFQFLTVRWTQ